MESTCPMHTPLDGDQSDNIPPARIGARVGFIGTHFGSAMLFFIQTCRYRQHKTLMLGVKTNTRPQHEMVHIAVEYRLECTILYRLY